MASTLPVTDETGEPIDYSHASYLRNCASGIAAIWDDHTLAIDAVNRDSQFNEFAPPYRQMKMAQARQAVAASTIKSIERLERISDDAERETNDLAAELSAPEKVDADQARVNVASYQALPKEKQVEMVHNVARMLADDSGVDGQTEAYGRAYLSSLLAVNPFVGLIDDKTRAFVTKVMTRTKDPAKWSRMVHLATAAKGIKEPAQRVRALISL